MKSVFFYVFLDVKRFLLKRIILQAIIIINRITDCKKNDKKKNEEVCKVLEESCDSDVEDEDPDIHDFDFVYQDAEDDSFTEEYINEDKKIVLKNLR